ncbi:hypothetical protein Val02_22860 [Virgisporangium aliadipatigenens]|uniref:Uncharacterized protein n=1 Tax=Virgisporangium aliadipatigenens TaxID=741659 RepID=A0A8J4DNZ0_9ACTN|nr:lasso RiPP family leader peptide-containing protein [Virgisporangium aliadipatigenens]GIJ45400.1 hypothetical protein Val02_22860 [Virgisporangium aliadipatigenens]
MAVTIDTVTIDAKPPRTVRQPEEYRPPMIEALGSLRKLTKGAGPGGMPIVMQTGGIPGM